MAKKKSNAVHIAFSLQAELALDGWMLLLPIARPSESAWDKELLAEVRNTFGDAELHYQFLKDRVKQLDRAGRVAWGWSHEFRAKTQPMTWAAWDKVCQTALGVCPALAERPAQFNLDHLCDEVAALIREDALQLEGNYPIGSTLGGQGSKKPATAQATASKRKRLPVTRRSDNGEDLFDETSSDSARPTQHRRRDSGGLDDDDDEENAYD